MLFIYITRIASNEIFSYSNKTIICIFIALVFITILYLLIDNYFLNINYKYIENLVTLNINYNYNLTKYFNYPSIIIIFFIIIYLFITLVAVVKITKIEYGPLRQKF